MIGEDEDEQAFLLRRIDEEKARIARSSCLVRAVHEEMAELYEDRAEEAEATTHDLEALLAQLNDVQARAPSKPAS